MGDFFLLLQGNGLQTEIYVDRPPRLVDTDISIGKPAPDNNAFQRTVKANNVTDTVQVVRCKNCRRRGKKGQCPLIRLADDPALRKRLVYIDYSEDYGFCHYGDRNPESELNYVLHPHKG